MEDFQEKTVAKFTQTKLVRVAVGAIISAKTKGLQ